MKWLVKDIHLHYIKEDNSVNCVVTIIPVHYIMKDISVNSVVRISPCHQPAMCECVKDISVMGSARPFCEAPFRKARKGALCV